MIEFCGLMLCVSIRQILVKEAAKSNSWRTYTPNLLNLIWLGDDDADNTEKADQSISAVLQEIERETKHCKLTDLIYTRSGGSVYSGTPVDLTGVDLVSLNHHFGSDWFTRVWIIQEAALPPRSLCYRGSSVQYLERVLRVGTWLQHKSMFMPKGWERAIGFWSARLMFDFADLDSGWEATQLKKGKPGTSMLKLLGSALSFVASDDRDHIYGVLGLHRKYLRGEELPAAFIPDYRKSTIQVCQEATRHIVMENHDLHFLYHLYPSPETVRDTQWPSWLPRWKFLSHKYDKLNEGDFEVATASGPRTHIDPDSNASSDSNILTVSGIRLGTVTRLTSEFSRENIVAHGAAAVRKNLDEATAIDCELPREPHGADYRLAHTIIGGADAHLLPISPARSADLLAVFRHDIYDIERLPYPQSAIDEDYSTADRDAANFYRAFADRALERCIFSTSSGHLGRALHFIEAGDIVVVLWGMKHPSVLRPTPNQKSRYKFVSICWVYGIMEGEAVAAHNAAGGEDEIFNLC